jgi:phage-related protein
MYNTLYPMRNRYKIRERIYVLHAFQKKSKQGIKTPQSDIDLIKQRYKDAIDREQEIYGKDNV